MRTLFDQLAAIVGSEHLITPPDLNDRPASWRGGNTQALALVRPSSTEQVSAIFKLCNDLGQAVVVQGGKTGLVDGATSNADQLIVSTERMHAIEQFDAANRTMTVQAGVPLQVVQEAAREQGLQYPMDLGARGSATIGGNISTNAGGNRVLRYGMTRNLVLGLEAVLPNGEIVSSMSQVLKNNAGYDLKQLFIGSEGTLGTVTKAVLRLSPAYSEEHTALLAVERYDDVITLLHTLDSALGGSLSSFEVMWQSYYQFASSHLARPPLPTDHGFYVLIESQSTEQLVNQDAFEDILGEVFEAGLVTDAVIAKSQTERESLWAIRDNIESMNHLAPVFYFDISLPIDKVGEYLALAEADLYAQWPNMTHAVFGHLGDGNIHIIASIGSDDADQRHRFDDTLYKHLQRFGGSISAEHGIGIEKRPFLHYSRSPSELALMRTLKTALDPKQILNPDKVFI